MEQDDLTFTTIAKTLGLHGFTISNTTADHVVAVAKKVSPALLVISVDPSNSGYATYTKLRGDPGLANVPFMLTSAGGPQASFSRHKAFKIHADGYLSKPLSPEKLLREADRLIGLGKSKSPANGVTAEDPIRDKTRAGKTGPLVRRPSASSRSSDVSATAPLENSRLSLGRRHYQLSIQDDEGKLVAVPVIREEITIGRAEGNTIRLSEQNVSRKHARFLHPGDDLHIEDLGSYNGTRVNGDLLRGTATLNDGDSINIGDYHITVRQVDAAQYSYGAHPVAETPAPDLDVSASIDDSLVELDELLRPAATTSADLAELDTPRPVNLDRSGPTVTSDSNEYSNTLSVALRIDRNGCISAKAEEPTWSNGLSLDISPPIREHLQTGSAERHEVESVGAKLFGALCAYRPFQEAYASRIAQATETRPLRLVLELAPNEGDVTAYDVANQFWETLRDSETGHHLSIWPNTRVVRRYIGSPHRSPPQQRHPQKLTVAFSNPRLKDDGSPAQTLDLFRELKSFRDLANTLEGPLKLNLVYRLGLDNAKRVFGSTGVFHFSGHAKVGEIHLEGPDEPRAQPLTESALRDLLTSSCPEVCILNCCDGGLAQEGIGAVAKAFLDGGSSLVVAMMGRLRDSTAVLFAREFYSRIAAGEDVEDAAQKTRWRLFAERLHSDWFLPAVWTCVDRPFAVVPPLAEAGSASTQARGVWEIVHALDQERLVLTPRVVVEENVAKARLRLSVSDRQLDQLVDTLTQQIQSTISLNLPTQVLGLDERVRAMVSDERRMNDLVRSLPQPEASEDSLRKTVTMLQSDLLPQVAQVASHLPALLRVLTGPEDSSAEGLGGETPTGPPSDDPPLGIPVEHGHFSTLVDVAKGKLVVSRDIVERCLINLLSGRHLVLTGPPGTGKSTLATNLAKAFGYHAEVVTATPDWTTFNVIGGLFPVARRGAGGRTQLCYTIRPGCVTSAVRQNWGVVTGSNGRRWQRAKLDGRRGIWLVIDEMNRAPMDQAFGDLFTALVSGVLAVPRIATEVTPATREMLPIPADFRLIGSANTADRHLLFELSEALKRRFAFVEVPAFDQESGRSISESGLETLLDQLQDRHIVKALANGNPRRRLSDFCRVFNPILARIRVVHPLGIAQVLDVITCCYTRGTVKDDRSAANILNAVLPDQLLPLLESLQIESLRFLISLLEGTLRGHLKGIVEDSLNRSEQPSQRLRHLIEETGAWLAEENDPAWQGVAEAIGKIRAQSVPDWSQLLDPLNGPPEIIKLPGSSRLVDGLRRLAQRGM